MNDFLFIIIAILGLLLLAFAAIHIWVYLGLWLAARKLASHLRKRQRTMSLSEARQRLARNEGMIVVDAPTLGWNISRVWWSSRTDFISPTEPPADALFSQEDLENYRRFIDEETGSACLVHGFLFGGNVRKYLLKHFQLKDCPFIFTGAILLRQKTPKPG